MALYADRVEIEVRCIHACLSPARQTVVVVGRRAPSTGRVLSIDIGEIDIRVLLDELAGGATACDQALGLVRQVAAVYGGRLAAAHLAAPESGMWRGAIELDTPIGPVEVATSPAQAVALAQRLGLPLLADRELFEAPTPQGQPLSDPITAFLQGLDLSQLDGLS